MTRRLQLLLPVAMAILFLCGLFFLSYAGQSRLLHAVADTKEALTREERIDRFFALLLEAETAQRGYILTGGSGYLEPYTAAVRELEPALDRLFDRYESVNREALDVLRAIRLETGTKLGEMRTTLALYERGGLAPALAVVQTDEGEMSMHRIQALLTTLRVREQTVIDAADATWRREVLLARLTAGVGSLMTVLLLAVAGRLILGNLRKQDELNATLREQANTLQRAVDERAHELSDLAANLQNVAENEKAALARELHDELGGTLTGAKMDLSWLRKRTPGADPAVAARWERLERALETGIDFKRRVVEQLRPTLLDNLGLYAAARWLTEETCKSANLAYTIDLTEPEPIIESASAIALFRVLQEALTNVVKHANATRVAISVQADDDSHQIRLVIEDDGTGISPERLSSLGGHGLGSMRQRMRAIGGQFLVRAKPGGGTEITAFARLAPAQRAHASASAQG